MPITTVLVVVAARASSKNINCLSFAEAPATWTLTLNAMAEPLLLHMTSELTVVCVRSGTVYSVVVVVAETSA